MDNSIKALVDSAVEMINMTADAIIEKGVLKKYAKIARVYCDELKDSGFTDEAAIKIVSNFNFSSK